MGHRRNRRHRRRLRRGARADRRRHVAAVASRTAEGAATFADRFGIPSRHARYEGLADDPDVDVVYVATPQSRHAADTILYLEAGKHVLCEKPFALDAAQARAMVDAARANGVFLMEAMWSRFLPSYRHLVDRSLAEGRIGDPLLVEADFGFRVRSIPITASSGRISAAVACSTSGIYPLQLCSLVLGPLERSAAAGRARDDRRRRGGRRRSSSTHDGGIGVIKAGLRVGMACTGRIAGTHGIIEIPALMHCPESITVSVLGRVEHIDGSL